MKTPLELLIEGRALITPFANWTQDAYARDHEGHDVEPTSDEAACFCTLGALYRAEGQDPGFETPDSMQGAINLLETVANARTCGIYEFNDSHTHKEVLAVWDRAIELAKNQLPSAQGNRSQHFANLNHYRDEQALGKFWQIDEDIYEEFLNMLPPVYCQGGFRMIEKLTGDISATYLRVGNTFWCGYSNPATNLLEKIPA